MTRLLLKNGTVIHAHGQFREDILIEGERIFAIGPNLSCSSDTPNLDVSGKLIFPGCIDPHTHMGIPIKGGTSADDFLSGTPSALHGGVTSILDFTVLENGQSLSESLDKRLELASQSVCDVGFHVNVSRFDENLLDEIPRLAEQGFNSFKTFTTYREAGMMLDYHEIELLAQRVARIEGVLMVHAEDDAVIQKRTAPYLAEGQTHPRYHGLSRPAEAEAVAVQKLGEISDRTGCHIYIVHLNTARGLEIASGFERLSIETCPHYLFLTNEAYETIDGAMYVASPPLRTAQDQEALWRGILDGRIHTLGSDHCPFCRRDKAANTPFQDIPNGMGGVETLFPTVLARFLNEDHDLSRLTELCSFNPALIFGVNHRKGALKAGMDADLLVVDPTASRSDWEANLITNLDWNAYTGLPALFPERVMRRGEWVTDDMSPGIMLRAK